MSTRSSIAMLMPDGKIKAVYCHWDGYIDHVGRTLIENYVTKAKVERLLGGGDISSLGKSCEKPAGHSFATPEDGYTIYYKRDRGEDGVDFKMFNSIKGWIKHYEWSEYFYLFAENGWMFSQGESEMMSLLDEVKKIDAEKNGTKPLGCKLEDITLDGEVCGGATLVTDIDGKNPKYIATNWREIHVTGFYCGNCGENVKCNSDNLDEKLKEHISNGN